MDEQNQVLQILVGIFSDIAFWLFILVVAICIHKQYSITKSANQTFEWLWWDFSGLRFITSKIFPKVVVTASNRKPPVTFLLWVIGIYTALFGIASNRYESAVDKIENRMNTFITQLAIVKNPEVRKIAFFEIVEIQHMRCPVHPELLKPSTIFLSLAGYDYYDETVTVLTRTLEKYRDDLEGAWLGRANLKGANLQGANLEGARFMDANLEGANLEGANLEGSWLGHANLENALLNGDNLKGAALYRTNLKDAELKYANLEDAESDAAYLEGAVLNGANLVNLKIITTYQLCLTRNLYQATMDPELEAQVKEQCPELLEDPMRRVNDH